jgi:hypothetical protein
MVMDNFIEDDPSWDVPKEPPKKPKITRANISEHLVDYQLAMIGKTIEEARITEFWYSEWTMTQAQHEEFKKYAIPLLKKVFKFNTRKAESTFQFFDFQFGLRITPNP